MLWIGGGLRCPRVLTVESAAGHATCGVAGARRVAAVGSRLNTPNNATDDNTNTTYGTRNNNSDSSNDSTRRKTKDRSNSSSHRKSHSHNHSRRNKL